MTPIRKRTSRVAAPAPRSALYAIALLRADHKSVANLFAEYAKTRSIARKKALVAEICLALSVHAQIEEEIFYPAVKAALKDRTLVPEATVEHAGVKDLIAQLRGVEPDGDMYDAKVKEEQTGMFPRIRASLLDMIDLGARMTARKSVLLAQAA